MYIVLLIMVLLACIVGLITVFSFFYGSFKVYGSAPYVPVSDKDLDIIIEHLQLKGGSILYDLGSGDGRVLLKALQVHPDIQAVGYEIAPMPRIISKIRLSKYRDRAKINNQNFYDADLTPATHLFLYLFPQVMVDLEPILDHQLRPGTRVISIDFTFPTRKLIQTLDISGPDKITKQLHVYEW